MPFQDILISLFSAFETPALGHKMRDETQAGYVVGLGYCCLGPLQRSPDCTLPWSSKRVAAAPHASSVKWPKCQMKLVAECLAMQSDRARNISVQSSNGARREPGRWGMWGRSWWADTHLQCLWADRQLFAWWRSCVCISWVAFKRSTEETLGNGCWIQSSTAETLLVTARKS